MGFSKSEPHGHARTHHCRHTDQHSCSAGSVVLVDHPGKGGYPGIHHCTHLGGYPVYTTLCTPER